MEANDQEPEMMCILQIGEHQKSIEKVLQCLKWVWEVVNDLPHGFSTVLVLDGFSVFHLGF